MKLAVKFLKNHTPYIQGDVTKLETDEATTLIEKGIVELVVKDNPIEETVEETKAEIKPAKKRKK